MGRREWTVTEIASHCGDGQASSQAIIEQYLEQITADNEALHAFVEVFADAARERAAELDRCARTNGSTGPLHGVPIAVKDLAHIAGRPPGFGSRCYHPQRIATTAPAIQRLIDAGAIIIGMTHMVEFASGGWGTNRAVGTPWNPVDRRVHRVPGGSSSGSGVAVAAGLVPAAIGSDTGGSVRIPASLCGIVGFKPSFGLIPMEGIAPLGPTFDTLGPITTTVADARLLFAVMSGRQVAATEAARPLRIGIPTERQVEPCDADILANFRRSVEDLRAKGHAVETVTMPLDMPDYQALTGQIVAYEAYRYHRALVEDETTPIDPFVRQRVLAGRDITDDHYAAMREQVRRIRGEARAALPRIDVFAFPSTPLPAIPLSEVDDTTIPMSRYTRMGNCLDLPAISIPNGVTSSELPTGFQLMSWTGSDALVLEIAEQASASQRP